LTPGAGGSKRGHDVQGLTRFGKEDAMVFSVAFSHKPADCPAAHKEQMEGFTRLVSPETLKGRGIRLLEGYVDRL